MKLRMKFNLVLILIFLIGFVGIAMVSNLLLRKNARDEVLRDAGLIMESALSVRQYTVDQIRPELNKLPVDVFLPQTVPAYAATEVIAALRKNHPDYGYKEATLNPTNPRDRATDWEADIITQFRQGADAREVIGERDTPSGRQLYIARPIRMTNEACLVCHTTADMAPASMVKIYGPANGYGWKMNEVIGAQVVTVPMEVPNRNANQVFITFMGSLAAIFVVLFAALNIMLGKLIVSPIRRLSEAADKISTGDFTEPEFSDKGKDEMALLSSSFNRMRRSLEKAMQMIEE